VDPVGEGEDLVEGGQNRALVVGDLLAPDRCPGFVDRGKPVMGFTGVDPDPEAGQLLSHVRLLGSGSMPFGPRNTRRQLRKQRAALGRVIMAP
jgi:hypothetical protein